MAKTRAQGLVLLKNILGTTSGSGGTWGDELYDWMIDGQNTVAMKAPVDKLDSNLVILRETDTPTTATTEGTVTLDPTNTMLRLLSVSRSASISGNTVRQNIELLPDATALWRRASNSNYSSGNTHPFCAVFGNNQIVVWPGTTSTTYYLDYVKMPDALSATQNYQIPDYLFELSIYYAARIALLQSDEFEKAMKVLEIVESRIQYMEQRYNFEPPKPFVDVPEKR